MKINKEDPAFPSGDQSLSSYLTGHSHRGLPARLLIAAMLMSRDLSVSADFALKQADELVERHNATSGEDSDA